MSELELAAGDRVSLETLFVDKLPGGQSSAAPRDINGEAVFRGNAIDRQL